MLQGYNFVTDKVITLQHVLFVSDDIRIKLPETDILFIGPILINVLIILAPSI